MYVKQWIRKGNYRMQVSLQYFELNTDIKAIDKNEPPSTPSELVDHAISQFLHR